MALQVRIRLGLPRDAPDMGRLARRVVRRWVLPEQPARAAEPLLAMFSARVLRERMLAGYRFHLAFVDGVLVGVAAVRDDSHLFQFFVSTRHQRRGIARRLWSRAMADAVRRAGTTRFTLNASDGAIPVYLALGFVCDGPRRTHANGVRCTPMCLMRATAPVPHKS